MTTLVIVESPSKAKTIKKYLGNGYEVIASKGHIVDLPKSTLAIDVENSFNPEYVVTKNEALKQLKKAFKDKKNLILAVDPDREGEAIGWHVAQKLGVLTASGSIKKGYELSRIVFTSITKESIQEAIKQPRNIDMDLVNAQQARRVLDRLVGYQLSPLIWKKISFGLSAGRVQSVAVRLIVEREEEREAFVSDEYWSIEADVDEKVRKKEIVRNIVKLSEEDQQNPKFQKIKFDLVEVDSKKIKIEDEKAANKIIDVVEDREWRVRSVSTKVSNRSPKPPFTTSTLQQIASNKLGYNAKRTMSIAQKLYESGLITYMRTDSTFMSEAAISQIRKLVGKKYGDNYLPAKPNYYKTSSKVAQEAHECIRPADFAVVSGKLNLSSEEQKLYDLIYSRAMGSQMSSARIESGNVDILVENCLFRANGQKIVFDGYLKLYPEKVADNPLPQKISKGDVLHLNEIYGIQHFTQPPGRFTEASLIKTLEYHGVGRPSTYVPIISTIQSRRYVEKDGKVFVPTDTGRIVTKLLRDHFFEIVDYKFTAQIEDNLDEIATGKLNWVKMIEEFYMPFSKKLKKKDKEIDRADYTVLGMADKSIKCPICSKRMQIKLGRYGRFYSCDDWPDCKGMLGIDGRSDADYEKESKSERFKSIYLDAPKTDSGDAYLLKKGRYGYFWAHPEYPKKKDAKPLEYREEVKEKIYGEPPKSKDGKAMILRRGRFGEFWAHPEYPDTKEVQRIDKKRIEEAKQELGIK
jgi:DNA topoisomerase I